MTKSLAVAFLVLLFIAGIAAGVAIDRIFLLEGGPRGGPPGRHGPPPPELLLARIDRELALTDAQKPVVHAALEEAQQTASGVFARTRPELDAARATARTKIRAVLDDAQRTKLDAMLADMERRGPPGGPPGGPPPHGPRDGRGPPPGGPPL
jgi:hypothetical protein